MDDGTLGAVLEREHREIDAGIEAFRAGTAGGARPVASLTGAMEALRRHIYLEEEFLFPPMRAELAIPMRVMLREHGELWTAMDAVEATLATGDENAALAACQQLLDQLDRHNAKEEPIFYTRADVVLTPAARTELTAFLESARMPDGWVCERAQPSS